LIFDWERARLEFEVISEQWEEAEKEQGDAIHDPRSSIPLIDE
jgi:hypothetical protein